MNVLDWTVIDPINTDSLIRMAVGVIVTIILLFCYLKLKIPMLTIVVYIITLVINIQLLYDAEMLFYPYLQLLLLFIDTFILIEVCWRLNKNE